MIQKTAVLSYNLALSGYLARHLRSIPSMEVLQIKPEQLELVSSGTIVLIDAACLYQSNVYSFIRSFGIHRHSLSIVVFGEPNDHKNQRHVITGAMDYISQGMLTAPDFKEYLQTRIERHWLPLSALS